MDRAEHPTGNIRWRYIGSVSYDANRVLEQEFITTTSDAAGNVAQRRSWREIPFVVMEV